MTDQQLIELIENKAPEELSADEIALIRKRLADSPALRAAASRRLEMERYLSDVIGGADINVSAEQIIQRAKYAPALRDSGILSALGWAFCLLLVGFVCLVLALAYFSPPPHGIRDRQLADADSTARKDPVESRKGIDPATEKSSEKSDPVKSAATPEPAAHVDREKPSQPISNQPPKPAELPPKTGTAKPVPAPETVKQPIQSPLPERQPWDLDPGAKTAAPSLFADLTAQVTAPNHAELKRWLTQAPGQNLNIAERDVYGLRCAIFDGVGKLQAPLKPETALRLSLFEHHRLQIHCFNGQQGVTLAFSEHGTPAWAAYRAERQGNQPNPQRLELLCTDEDRYWRTGPTPPVTFELRYGDGLLTLSRGRVRLLDVPVMAMPDEIYLEGHAIVRQMQVVPADELIAAAQPVQYDAPSPASGKWKGELVTGSDFIKREDGSVELTGEKTKERPWVAVALHRTAPSEVVLQLDGATPGTGIYLGDEQGTPRYQIAFLKEQRTGGLMMTPLAVGDLRVEHHLDVNQMPQPLAIAEPCLKLVSGCGTLKCWLSADGVHWGRPFEPNNNYQGPIDTVGIFCQPGDPKRAIRLSKLAVRELPGLSKLATEAARAKAKPIVTAPDIGVWLEAMLSSQPADTDVGDWRRASALATLAHGPSTQLGMPLLTALIEEILASNRQPSEKILLLNEAMQLANVWDDPGQALRFARYYEDVGRQAYAAGEQRPFTLIAEPQMTSPIWCRATYNFTPEELLRTELLELAYAGDWHQAAQLAQQWRFYRRPPMGQQPQPGLIEWTLTLAGRELPRNPAAEQLTLLNDWRHPLVAELSKEGFNVLAEFEAALEGKLYKDACQIITTAAANQSLGLLPDSRDQRLMTSLAGAVSIAMQDHSELQATMTEQFGPIGALRVRQAIADGDAAAIEAATLQFFGTPAAANAHLWLGDRALAGGEFAQALAHYRQAQATAPLSLQNRVAAGLQIAGAMTGQSIQASVSDAVQFGETRLTPAELANLVADLKKHHAADAPGLASTDQLVADVPKPTSYEAQIRGRVDGEFGENPQNVPGELNQFEVDWVARQCSTIVDGNRLILSNRFQVSAFDLASGQWQWRYGLGGEQAQSHDWNLVPMRPVVTANRTYVRRLHKQGPVLSCVESATGKPVWSAKIEPDRPIISDPLLIQDQLFALCAARIEQDFMLVLTSYDPATGDVIAQKPLIAMRDTWLQQRQCQVLPAGDSFIVCCAGAVLCCDPQGQTRWVRKQTWIPANLDRSWVTQHQAPPILRDNRLYVTQPGVRAVVCLDAGSGRLIWQRVLPDAQRIAVSADRLIVRSRDGAMALNAKTGDVLWQKQIDRMLDGQLVGQSGPMIFTVAEQVKGENNWRPVLVWIDPATGSEVTRYAIESLKHERPKLGPLLVHDGKVWGLFGRGEQDPNREFVQLTPKGDALAVAVEPAPSWRPWSRHVEPSLQSAVGTVLPGWTMVDGRAEKETGLQNEWQGEKNLLNTLAFGGRPMKLVRELTVPREGNPRLVMKVAGDPQGKWKLQVDAAGDKLFEQAMSQETTASTWKEFSVDLAKYKGRDICLVVRQIEEAGPQPFAKWKRLEIVK